MLDTQTKRRIDTCRNILVGKVPDPKSQVEQITIALIYKFMDDMDLESEEMGGARTFFAGEFERYAWAKLVAPGVGGQEMLNTYSEALTRMVENAGIPELFRSIFRNAYLPYRDPETLRSFLREINGFTYDHSERLGDAFEYLLSVLGSQGDAGQFRTPRHIIDFMVEIIDPKKDEVILDPACGTAGFLISSYKHILKANSTNSESNPLEAGPENDVFERSIESPLRYPGDLLSPEEKRKLASNIKGYDISPDMVRLSRANMYLHGFAQPLIEEFDTLGDSSKWNEQADVILANPPFMTPKGGANPHSMFSVTSSRTEALFLDYIINHLSERGRAAVIVPEGVHFNSQSAFRKLRKVMLEKDYLIADITLPHGVFKPYASVKTHILVLDRVSAKKNDSILFIEIENDGYSQSDTRTAIPGSQLEQALALYKKFVADGKVERFTQIDQIVGQSIKSYCIDKKIIEGNRNTHLIGRWNLLNISIRFKSKFEVKKLSDICDVRVGISPTLATTPGDYTFVVSAKEKRSAAHWDYEGKGVCIPVVSSAGHGKAAISRVHYAEGKFALASTMCVIFPKNEKLVNPMFLYYFLQASKDSILVPLMCGATNVTLDLDELKDVCISIPDIETQNKIVEAEGVELSCRNIVEWTAELEKKSSLPSISDNVFNIRQSAFAAIESVNGLPRIAEFSVTVWK